MRFSVRNALQKSLEDASKEAEEDPSEATLKCADWLSSLGSSVEHEERRPLPMQDANAIGYQGHNESITVTAKDHGKSLHNTPPTSNSDFSNSLEDKYIDQHLVELVTNRYYEKRPKHQTAMKERPLQCPGCHSTFVHSDLLLRHDCPVHNKSHNLSGTFGKLQYGPINQAIHSPNDYIYPSQEQPAINYSGTLSSSAIWNETYYPEKIFRCWRCPRCFSSQVHVSEASFKSHIIAFHTMQVKVVHPPTHISEKEDDSSELLDLLAEGLILLREGEVKELQSQGYLTGICDQGQTTSFTLEWSAHVQECVPCSGLFSPTAIPGTYEVYISPMQRFLTPQTLPYTGVSPIHGNNEYMSYGYSPPLYPSAVTSSSMATKESSEMITTKAPSERLGLTERSSADVRSRIIEWARTRSSEEMSKHGLLPSHYLEYFGNMHGIITGALGPRTANRLDAHFLLRPSRPKGPTPTSPNGDEPKMSIEDAVLNMTPEQMKVWTALFEWEIFLNGRQQDCGRNSALESGAAEGVAEVDDSLETNTNRDGVSVSDKDINVPAKIPEDGVVIACNAGGGTVDIEIHKVSDVTPGSDEDTNEIETAWKEQNSLMILDGGGIRGYGSLLVLKVLMSEIADEERKYLLLGQNSLDYEAFPRKFKKGDALIDYSREEQVLLKLNSGASRYNVTQHLGYQLKRRHGRVMKATAQLSKSSPCRIFEIPSILDKQHRVNALGDYCAKRNFMKEEYAKRLNLDIDRDHKSEVIIGSGTKVATSGVAKTFFRFSNESEEYPLVFHILPSCIHNVILGKGFLKATKTFSNLANKAHRIKERILTGISHRHLLYLGDSAPRFEGLVNGSPEEALADSGAKVLVMDEDYAMSLGLSVERGQRYRTRLKFADESTAYTSGMTYGVEWKFGHGGDSQGYQLDFHVLKNAPAKVILSDEFLFGTDAFAEYECFLVDEDDEDDDAFFFAIDVDANRPNEARLNMSSIANMQHAEMVLRGEKEDHIADLPPHLRQDAWREEIERRSQWERDLAALQLYLSSIQATTLGSSSPSSGSPPPQKRSRWWYKFKRRGAT